MSAVDRAKGALEGVTKGPWAWASVDGDIYEKGRLDGGEGGYDEIVWPGQVSCMSYCYGGSSNISADNPEHDWPFIAAARTLVPELITECESWQDVAKARQALIEQLKAEKRQLASEVDRLRNREIPPTVTRVDIVGNDVREYWADQWTPYVGDNGRTLKLFALGKGAVAKAERDTALGKELAAVLERRYCNGCGGAFVGAHACGRKR